MATKLDRILEGVESLLEDKKKAGVDGIQNTDQPQQNDVSIETENVNDGQIDNVETDESVESQQEQQDETQAAADNFDEEFAQLVNMFSNKEQTTTEGVTQQKSDTVIDFSEKQNQTPDKDYQKLYEEELQKRMDLEGSNRDLSGQINYLKNSLDKEGEKYWELMDKNKSIENELRTVSSRTIPENFVPLAQTYNLWQETNIPAHKWRAVKEALTIVENMTGVPASEYYNKIIQAENHDIPEVNDTSSTISKVGNNDKKSPGGFILL